MFVGRHNLKSPLLPAAAPVFWVAVLLLMPGCQWARCRGPVPEALVQCRQKSQQAMAAFESGDESQAAALLQGAIEQCPEDAEARQFYAQVLRASGNDQGALLQLQEAEKLASSDATIQTDLAALYLDHGQMAQAHAHIHKAVDLDPKLAAAWKIRAKLAQAEHDTQAAMANALRALALDSDDEPTLLQVAALWRQQGKPDQALCALDSLGVHDDPTRLSDAAIEAYALTYRDLRQLDMAGHYCKVMVDRQPTSAEAWFLLADVRARSGALGLAEEAAQTGLRMNPSHAGCLQLLAEVEQGSLGQGGGVLR